MSQSPGAFADAADSPVAVAAYARFGTEGVMVMGSLLERVRAPRLPHPLCPRLPTAQDLCLGNWAKNEFVTHKGKVVRPLGAKRF